VLTVYLYSVDYNSSCCRRIVTMLLTTRRRLSGSSVGTAANFGSAMRSELGPLPITVYQDNRPYNDISAYAKIPPKTAGGGKRPQASCSNHRAEIIRKDTPHGSTNHRAQFGCIFAHVFCPMIGAAGLRLRFWVGSWRMPRCHCKVDCLDIQ
jgi:hypothetical protein